MLSFLCKLRELTLFTVSFDMMWPPLLNHGTGTVRAVPTVRAYSRRVDYSHALETHEFVSDKE
jgi:hypothetical protein